jgi:hypothetical protein
LAAVFHLLRPDRFIVDADDPECLVGREGEIKDLADACEKTPVVFLEGESGTGKSALALAGLVPFLRTPAKSRQLVPVVLHASSLSWQDGLRTELARALARLSLEDCKLLGDGDGFGAADVFTMLGALPRHAPRRLLVIVDQVDDYLIAHRDHMRRRHTAFTPEELVQANADWGAVATLVKDDRLRLLLICRNDIFSRLDSFRFGKTVTFTLDRIDRTLITPLLDRLTRDDGKGLVVENPDDGWSHLKKRLLRDLSAATPHILPIQLAVALESLRLFSTLTVREYARQGGARGLERLHIQRRLAEIAGSRRLKVRALLRGLMLLVTERGEATQRATREAFCKVVLGRPADGLEFEPVIDHLERSRILRRQWRDDGEYLLLHHDYLAHSIWEAHGYANRWVEFLRQRNREFTDALNWWQCWRTLLPPITLVHLVGQRLRGRLRFGEHGSFVWWSLLRFAPLILFCVCLWLGSRWMNGRDQEMRAEGVFAEAMFGNLGDPEEAKEWTRLADAKEDSRFRAAQRGLAKPVVAHKLETKPETLTRAVVGLDPTGKLRRQFAFEILSPNAGIDPESVILVLRTIRLRTRDARSLTTTVVERMKTEQDGMLFASLGQTLGLVCGELETRDVQSTAPALIGRITAEMATEKDRAVFARLGQTLDLLCGKLEARDVQPAAVALIARMATEKESAALSRLGQTFARLSKKLDVTEVQPVAAALVAQMRVEENSETLAELGRTLSLFNGKTRGEHLRPAVRVLVERIKSEENQVRLYALGKTLALLCRTLEPKDQQFAASALVERMKGEESTYTLASLGNVLCLLNVKLEAKIAHAAAAALVDRMKTDRGPDFCSLASPLALLSGQLEVPDVQVAAGALAERMKTEKNSERLVSLGEALVPLVGKLDATELRIAATTLLERMKLEENSHQLARLAVAFGPLSGNLEAGEIQRAIAVLVQQLIKEKGPGAIANLGAALELVSERVVYRDVQAASAALVERMKTETDMESLVCLAEVLRSLSGRLMPRDIQAAVATLVGRVKTEENSGSRTKLSEALAGFSDYLRPEDARISLANLSKLAQVEVPGKNQAVAWTRLEAVAHREMGVPKRMQEYVDLLGSPLVVGEAREALLGGMEGLAGPNVKFDGDLWVFVEWATSSHQGKAMHLTLDLRKH